MPQPDLPKALPRQAERPTVSRAADLPALRRADEERRLGVDQLRDQEMDLIQSERSIDLVSGAEKTAQAVQICRADAGLIATRSALIINHFHRWFFFVLFISDNTQTALLLPRDSAGILQFHESLIQR